MESALHGLVVPNPTFPPPVAKIAPPAKVEVAVVEVALKYGAAIFDHDSIPPAKVEVAEDLIQIGRVVVGVRELMPKVLDCCNQS